MTTLCAPAASSPEICRPSPARAFSAAVTPSRTAQAWRAAASAVNRPRISSCIITAHRRPRCRATGPRPSVRCGRRHPGATTIQVSADRPATTAAVCRCRNGAAGPPRAPRRHHVALRWSSGARPAASASPTTAGHHRRRRPHAPWAASHRLIAALAPGLVGASADAGTVWPGPGSAVTSGTADPCSDCPPTGR